MELNSEDISYFYWNVLKLIDRGYYESIQTTEQHIVNRDVVEWLISRYSEKESLFQKFTSDDYTILNMEFNKFGANLKANPYPVTNNGLCLLLDIVFRFRK
jgi:hypothetical protein